MRAGTASSPGAGALRQGPLARQANTQALYIKGTGLPAGPHDSLYLKDTGDF